MSRSKAPELSWSKSRGELFESCEREYYLNYYQAWGGWFPSADRVTRKAHLLKPVTPRFAWAGDRVHREIASVLRTLAKQAVEEAVGDGDPEAPGEGDPGALLLSRLGPLRQAMRQDFADSANALAKSGKKACRLVEHENDLEVSTAEWARVMEKGKDCLRNLAASDLWARIVASAPRAEDDWLPVDELDSFEFADTKVWAAPDFAGRLAPDARYTVIDWKTGRPSPGDTLQLAGYAEYLRLKHGIPLEEQTLLCVYLSEAPLHVTTYLPTRELIAEFHVRARASIRAMREKHNDGVAKRADAFPKTTATRRCGSCRFTSLCYPNGVPQEESSK